MLSAENHMVNEGNLLYKLLLLPPLLLHPNICYVERQRRGNSAAAATSANAATAAGAARMVLIGGWSGDGRMDGGGGRPAGRRAHAASPGRGRGDYDPQFRPGVVEDKGYEKCDGCCTCLMDFCYKYGFPLQMRVDTNSAPTVIAVSMMTEGGEEGRGREHERVWCHRSRSGPAILVLSALAAIMR